MPVFANQSGAWDQLNELYANVSGTWKPVRKGWVNDAGTWKQFFANNTFEIFSLGLDETVGSWGGSGNHGLFVNGTNVFPGARSYNVALLDNYGNVTGTSTYDVFNGTTGATNAASMSSFLSGLNNGQLFVIFIYDEPQTNANDLTSAMTSLFGGTASIMSTSIPYRGAYLAMGYKGSPPVLEQYCGTEVNSVSNPSASTPQADAGCADGALVYKFQIYTTETTPGSPSGKFANLSAVYTGGNLVSNSAQTGGIAVSGMPFV